MQRGRISPFLAQDKEKSIAEVEHHTDLQLPVTYSTDRIKWYSFV